jgi:hypothetical protein
MANLITCGKRIWLWEQSLLAMQASRLPGKLFRLRREQALLPQMSSFATEVSNTPV